MEGRSVAFSSGARVASDLDGLFSGRRGGAPCGRAPWRSAVIALVLLLAAAMATLPTASANVQVQVRNLGALPGDSTSLAHGINDAGQVVGQSGWLHAFLWDNGTMTNLGNLGGPLSAATGINNAGQVVGTSETPSGWSHAFLWQNGTMIGLGTLGGGQSNAVAINDAGQIAGLSSTASGETHAFLWQNGTMEDLSTPPGDYTEAFGLNDAGEVVGILLGANGTDHAVLWENGIMHDLGTLNGATTSEAHGVNAAGQVVGTSGNAFLWQNGVMTDLGLGDALALNDAGQVVGRSGHAFLWENGVRTDLGTLGGASSEAQSINKFGQAVGGSEDASGVTYAVLWTISTPPPPYPIRDLGTPPGDVISWATAINDAGHVAGHSIGSDSGIWVIRAFLWTNGTFQVLPGLGGTETFANGINAADEVVGYGYTTSGPSRAILWQNGTPTDLGTLGWTSSAANGINNRGQVVGWSYNATGQQHAFLWDQGNMTDLGTLPGGSFSTADAINDAGQVVGAGDVASGVMHAFLWQSGTMTDLGPGWANGINDVGQIVGTDGQHAVLWENGGMVDLGWGKASSINHAGQIVGDGAASGEIHGFLWYHGNATDLGTWANDTSSQAVGINRDGQAVGFSGDQAHAVLWTLPRIAPPPPRFPMRDLGFLPGPYNSSSIAYGVNDVGQVVGAGWGANGVGGHAFLWDNGTMTDLGTLGGGPYYDYSGAYGINDVGQVVGWTVNATEISRAFLWTNGTMTDLGPSGAYAINNAGKIVGVSGPHASVWNNGAMTDLGTLGGLSSDAYGINEAGQIVGGGDSGSGGRACLWDNGTMTDLGTRVSDIGSWSYGVSNVGQAVGVSYAPYGASTSFHAVIWTIPRPEVHDVAVSSASASATAADVGVSMRITATVVNRGTQPESFDVSAYAGSVLVGTKAVTDLASGASQDISFSWDTSSAAPGSYPVRVEASPVSGETNIANNVASGLTVRLAPPVTAQASGTPSATDVGKAISFSCSPTDGTPPYQFFWDFGDGSQWTDSTATHTFTVSGTKSATCTITDSAGKESTSSTTVLVNPVPSVTVSVNHASAGRGAVVTFSAQVPGGPGPFEYVWDFGDDIGGTGAAVTHSHAAAGAPSPAG